MKKYFSPLRFVRTLNVEFIEQWRVFFFSAIVAGFLFSFFTLIMHLFERPFDNAEITFFFNLSLFFGIIAGSTMFSDIRNQQRGFAFYMMPASTFEKYMSKLLISTLGFFVFAIISMAAFSSLVSLLNMARLKSSFVTINPFTADMALTLWTFVFFHSLYFLGSIIFRKLPFILTTIILVATGVFLLVSTIVTVVVLGTNLDSATMEKIYMFFMQNKSGLSSWKDYLWYGTKAALPLGLYVLTFFLLKRRQLVE
jgi:hypothetical protein